jgi:hypothetical protein
MNKQVLAGKYWIHYGFTKHQFGFGVVVNKWQLNIDLGPFWFGIEW